jgi:N-acetylglucosamine-6-sulfatase
VDLETTTEHIDVGRGRAPGLSETRSLGRRMTVRIATLTIFLLLLSCPLGSERRACSKDRSEDSRPSLVLVLTDDQRWDTLWAMPSVRRILGRRGVTFRNSFVVNPHCCPSRATILTGQYSHSTGVYTNEDEFHGGFAHFDDASTIATWLEGAGYRTALMGKYLNGYSPGDAGYIPPGWDRWLAFATRAGGGGKYYDYGLSDDGKRVSFGRQPQDHSTDVLAQSAVDFICGSQGPLFLVYAPYAPHGVAIPAPRHRDEFDDLELKVSPSYDEQDVSDKPRWVRRLLRVGPYDSHPNYFQALLGVDEAVARVAEALRDSGRLHNTMIVFASDNGYMWGEHRHTFKLAPYEESIRVPFVVRFDRLIENPRIDRNLVLNLDLAPTFADAAGVDAPEAEGRSLLPLLTGDARGWREHFLIEHLNAASPTTNDPVPTYCALRTRRELYVAYDTGEEEYYDLSTDPYQLDNRADDRRLRSRTATLRALLRRTCRPRPPGYRIP